MEIKIGVQNVARELVVETNADAETVERAVEAALEGTSRVLRVVDTHGRAVMVPAAALGYGEVGEPTKGRVGFGI